MSTNFRTRSVSFWSRRQICLLSSMMKVMCPSAAKVWHTGGPPLCGVEPDGRRWALSLRLTVALGFLNIRGRRVGTSAHLSKPCLLTHPPQTGIPVFALGLSACGFVVPQRGTLGK